jgi:hypothetical protein
MKKNPLQTVSEKFGSKDKLVSELLSLIKRSADLSKDEFKKTLLAQSNRKLLVLHQRETDVKDRFGSKTKLVDALVSAKMGKNKIEDRGYRSHLEHRTNGQLLDMARRNKIQTTRA